MLKALELLHFALKHTFINTKRERERERDASGLMTRLTMIICYKLLKDEDGLNPWVGDGGKHNCL